MKTLFYFLAAAAMMLTACQRQPEPQRYVYLCIGQSNMCGAAPVEAQDSVVPARFLNLAAVNDTDRVLGQWREATAPLCRRYSGLSPVDYFGRTMVEHLPEHISVGVIHIAVNGTAIRIFDKDQYQGYVDSIRPDWMRREVAFYDGNPYERLVTLARQAQSEGAVIRGILLHQGETDAYNEVWPQTVKKIYGDLLTDLGLVADSVPLLAGEAVGIDQNGVCAHANPMIDRIHEFIPTAWTISSHACEAGPDHLHFSSEGYRRLGRRYAIRMLQLMGYPLADDTESMLQSELGDPADAFLVSVTLRADEGKIVIASPVALSSVDIVSFSGATLGTQPIQGRSITIDPATYPGEDRLVLNIRDAEGRVVNKQVNLK